MFIEHVAMYVNDLDAAREFFTTYFGATSNEGYHNKTTDFRSYFLSFDNGARLEIMHRPDMQDTRKTPTRTGLIHIAFSVGSTEQVDQLKALFTGLMVGVGSEDFQVGDEVDDSREFFEGSAVAV